MKKIVLFSWIVCLLLIVGCGKVCDVEEPLLDYQAGLSSMAMGETGLENNSKGSPPGLDGDLPPGIGNKDKDLPPGIEKNFGVDYVVGDIGPAGGIIFFVDSEDLYDGWTYLEAAPSSTEFDTENNVGWGVLGDLILAPGCEDIGKGEENTNKIIASYPNGEYAANLCAALDIGGKSDWFLPSKDELVLMYELRDIIGGFTERNIYFSSSECFYPAFPEHQNNPRDEVWQVYVNFFGQPYVGIVRKAYPGRVRAIRAF